MFLSAQKKQKSQERRGSHWKKMSLDFSGDCTTAQTNPLQNIFQFHFHFHFHIAVSSRAAGSWGSCFPRETSSRQVLSWEIFVEENRKLVPWKQIGLTPTHEVVESNKERGGAGVRLHARAGERRSLQLSKAAARQGISLAAE